METKNHEQQRTPAHEQTKRTAKDHQREENSLLG